MIETDAGEQIARRAVANASPQVLAAAQALCAAENIPWGMVDVRQQYTFCCDAYAALVAADKVYTAHERLARVVAATGISLQTVTEVANALRRTEMR